ncbi:TRAP transporter small permease [Aureimonas fodinaquatilis]|uniref:TRAP transporter small permease protein n=1 Tax=Aureimonas fodinaquatilis TaxID=2565783 RepID=A0A5B0DUE6_9HYPH|nr:TRAP transporter small permease [Aureimonas fodinaquatilis]KAA0970437.1 TRAP transporter small permease [Aureimonas fodinaquatilis]
MKLVSVVHRIVDAVMVACLAVIVVAMISQVFARYVNHAAMAWPEELSQFLLVVLSFLGMYRAIGEKLHIQLSLLPEHKHPVLTNWLRALGLLTAGIFVVYIGYGGWHLAQSSWNQPSTAMRLPMGLFYGIIPIACLLSFFALLNQAWQLVRKDPAE